MMRRTQPTASIRETAVEPEVGDKSVRVTREDAAKALRSVGVEPGDTVMFHSSLSSMGTVVDGPNTVIDGFLEALGPDGTVAVPTLCNWTREDQGLVFGRWDPATSPSYVGAITETFRQRPDAVRSDNPTHSVAAVGARAAELTADHGAAGLRPGPFGEKAFAAASPWERFFQWNASYCFVGVDFRVNTMVHFVESLVVERALQRVAPRKRARLVKKVSGWMRPGVWPTVRITDRLIIQQILEEQGVLRRGRIGSATLLRTPARPMVNEWLGVMESEPEAWFTDDFLKWLRKTR